MGSFNVTQYIIAALDDFMQIHKQQRFYSWAICVMKHVEQYLNEAFKPLTVWM